MDSNRCLPPPPCGQPSIPTLVQNTARSFNFVVTSDGTYDFSTIVSAYLLVHRGSGAIERWTLTVAGGATPYQATLVCTLLGSVPGIQAVTTAGEMLRMRPYLHFASGPDIECDQTTMQVVEA